MRESFENSKWSGVAEASDANSAYNQFLTEFNRICNQIMPLTYSKPKCYPDFNKNWITPDIVKLDHRQNSIYRAYLKHRSQLSLNKYKSYKNKLNSITRAAENLLYTTKFDIAKDKIKKPGK